MRMQKIGALMNVLYIDLSRLYLPAGGKAGPNSTQIGHVRRLMQLVDNHYREIKSPTKYAEMMFMSAPLEFQREHEHNKEIKKG